MKPPILALAAAALVLAGCAAMRNSLLRPVVTYEDRPAQVLTNYVLLETNLVHIPATVDAAGNILTAPAIIERISTRPIPLTILSTNPAGTYATTNSWEKDPRVFETANIIGATIPGWGQLAAGTFGALGTLFAAYTNRRLKKSEVTTVSVIQGVDEFRRALQFTPQGKQLDAQLVGALRQAQTEHGALEAVAKLIELHTGKTIPLDLSVILQPHSTSGTDLPTTEKTADAP